MSESISTCFFKVNKSAIMEADDILLQNIYQTIKERRIVAKHMLSSIDEKKFKELEILYNIHDNNLKQLLNL